MQPGDLISAPDSLVANASCRTARLGDLWWRTPSSLCLSSGARLLLDLQNELGVAQRDQQAFWGRDLIETLEAAVRLANPAFVRTELPGAAETVVSRHWIAQAIWYTYHRQQYASTTPVIELPPSLTLPLLGATGTSAIPGFSGTVPEARCLAGFTRELPLTPTVSLGPEGLIRGTPPKKSSAWMVLGGLALAAVILGGR